MEIASLAGLDGLADLGLRSGADMRPTLLRILTDLYVQKFRHTPAEERHYTELALRLLDAVEVGTRAAVAGKLAHHLSPPLPVLQHLSRDVAEVAEPLRAHPLLQPPLRRKRRRRSLRKRTSLRAIPNTTWRTRTNRSRMSRPWLIRR
jgi:hypothetical protein